MGVLDFLRRPEASSEATVPNRDPFDDKWFEPKRLKTSSGVSVTVKEARKLPPVRGCLKLLGDSVGGLSYGVFAKQDNNDRKAMPQHELARLMSNPNPRETSFQFIANMVDDLAAEGMFLAERRLDAQNNETLWRVLPGRFTPEELIDGSLRFRVRRADGREDVLVQEEVWFIAVPPSHDGVRGYSPITGDGVEAIGAAIALQRYAARFFENDATPPFLFKHKGSFKDEQSKQNFLSAWKRWFGGKNKGKPGVLEFDMDVVQMAATNEQAQFLETRKELWLDISRLWRVPPHKIGILDRATFSNIEHQALEFVAGTLGPWLELIERSANKTFIERGEGGSEYFEFNVASLLRGDIVARYNAYAVGRQWGWLSVNEIRRMENQNGIGRAGDRYIEPLNMTSVGMGAEDGRSTEAAINFLRESVAANGGRPRLRKVIDNVA